MADCEEEAQPQSGAQPVVAEADAAASGSPSAAGHAEANTTAAPLSKNQQKKLMKQKLYEEKKIKRREIERQKKQAEQEKRRQEGRQRMDSMTEEEREKWRSERNARGVERKQGRQESRARMEQALAVGQKIVVDLDFADLMTDSELKSMCGQLAYCWHINCAAKHPAHLVMTSMEGKMENFMKKQAAGYVNWKATCTEKPYIEHFAQNKDKLVYLTADSSNELQELDPEAVYIVGGIVDRNRHKLLCYNKAEEQGIAHARLPIGDYIKLASSQVMTTNHVVDIMLRWLELRDWQAAFEAVIPIRKRKAESCGDGAAAVDEQEGASRRGQQERQAPAAKQQKQEGGDDAGAAAQGSGAGAEGVGAEPCTGPADLVGAESVQKAQQAGGCGIIG